jgi:glycosyltransferase involved in cell wall biosynthesis
VRRQPRISVLMAVYNGERYLREAIESILGQTYGDYEFLIIDDASTDATSEVIRSYADARIRLIRNAVNLGLARSLNGGLEASRGEYIARMDCDDISMTDRFARQVTFLDRRAEVAICGTQVEFVGGDPRWRATYPTEPDEVAAWLLFMCCLIHPSIMMRRSLLQAHRLRYDPAFPRTQDYDLFERCSRVCPLANLGEVLLKYRLHDGQVSRTDNRIQDELAARVQMRLLDRMGLVPSPNNFAIHRILAKGAIFPSCSDQLPASPRFTEDAHWWLTNLRRANERTDLFKKGDFDIVLSECWSNVCDKAENAGIWTSKMVFSEPLTLSRNRTWAGQLVTASKSYAARLTNKMVSIAKSFT